MTQTYHDHIYYYYIRKILPPIHSSTSWKRRRQCLCWRITLQATTEREIDSPTKHSFSWRHTEDVFSVAFFSFSRRLQDITARHLHEDVLKTSWKRLEEDVLQTRLEYISRRRLEDILKTSSRHLWKTFCKHVLKTSSRRLEEVLGNQKCLLGRSRLQQRVQCQLSAGLPKISLLLLCGSIEVRLSDTIVCLELDGGAGKYKKRDKNKAFKHPICR